MSFKTLILEQKNHALTITLNRPDVRNAFNDELILELTSVFRKEGIDPTVRVVSLRGSGKVFSAGGDLNWMKKSALYTEEQNYEDARKFSTLLETMNRLPKPLIGCVHGAALGGGMGLVSVCDTVMSSSETQFGFSEAKLGLIPAVILPFVMAKMGESQTRALFLTAEIFGAARARELGLVHHIVQTPAELENKAQELTNQILLLSPQALGAAKALIHTLKKTPWESQHDLAAKALASIRRSPEAKEGITAFLEKRKPKW